MVIQIMELRGKTMICLLCLIMLALLITKQLTRQLERKINTIVFLLRIQKPDIHFYIKQGFLHKGYINDGVLNRNVFITHCGGTKKKPPKIFSSDILVFSLLFLRLLLNLHQGFPLLSKSGMRYPGYGSTLKDKSHTDTTGNKNRIRPHPDLNS